MEVLDRVAVSMARAVEAASRGEGMRDALAGRWLGHALHPLLTDFPLGMWIGASVQAEVGPST
jgi:hypothetical protein